MRVGSKTKSAARTGWSAGDWLVLLLLVLLHAGTAGLFLANTGSDTDAAWTGVPLDDAWIHFVYARNLVDHGGLLFNPGEPEAGFTSPLWILLLGLCHLLLSPLGLGFLAVAKGLGVLLAVTASLLAYLVVLRLSGSRAAGLLAGALVAVDPTFAFAKVSGMEVSLTATTMLLVVYFFAQKRYRLAGLALGATILARPEGLVLFAAVGLALGLRLLWDALREREMHFKEPVAVILPAVLMVLPMALYYHSVNGTPFPNTYLVKRAFHGGGGTHCFGAVWEGYLAHLSWLAEYAWLVCGPLLVLGAITAMRRRGLGALPLVLAPMALCAGLAMTLAVGPEEWNFYARRYLDGAIPLIVVLVVLGIWRLQRRWTVGIGRTPVRRALAVAVAAGCLVLPAVEGYGLWRRLPEDFSWNCRNIEEVNVRMAHWVRDNLPPDALVAVGDAGAIRFLAPNPMLDLVGLNTHEAIGIDDYSFMTARRVDYAVIFPGPAMDGWPHSRRIHEIGTDHNTILGADHMVVYETIWEPPFADATRCQGGQSEGWNRIGRLDVGKTGDEKRYSYEITSVTGVFQREFKAGPKTAIRDDGRGYTGTETMRVPTRRRTDLLVVKRYDAAVRGEVVVLADGAEVGHWTFAPRPYQFGEDAFLVPASFIESDTTRLAFEFVPGSDLGINSFHYWFYTR
ncbi:MAG: hypothetical protein GY838_14420 [bacterium]|nr:hypothetical protein [bacterium]